MSHEEGNRFYIFKADFNQVIQNGRDKMKIQVIIYAE